LKSRFQPVCGIEPHLEVDLFHLPTPYVFNVQAEQGVLMIEALCHRFNYIGEPQVDKDMISQDEVPFGIDFLRHLEGVNEGLNGWAIAQRSRPAVKPQPDDLGIVERRPASEDGSQEFIIRDGVVSFHFDTQGSLNDLDGHYNVWNAQTTIRRTDAPSIPGSHTVRRSF
jgi:hypothetical protein